MSAARHGLRDRRRSPPRDSHEHRRRRDERRERSASPEDGSRRGRRDHRSRSPQRRYHRQEHHHNREREHECHRERRTRAEERSKEPDRRHRHPVAAEEGRSTGDREPPRRERERESLKRKHHRESEPEDRIGGSGREEGKEEGRRRSGERAGGREEERDRPSRQVKNGERGEEEGTGRGERRETHQREKEREIGNQEEEQYEFGGREAAENAAQSVQADEPNYALSGKLTAETNTYKGVVIKYNEPPEARKPKTRWRLYPFKGDETLPTLFIHRQSAYLIGRDRRIVDLAVDHPSCSKQHAVLQYRLVQYQKETGGMGRKVKPYIIDLESTNGTYINNQRIDAAKYMELKEKDMIKFGFSSREYILLHEHSIEIDDEGTP